MDTSCNHLREPGYQESSFIRARGYLHDLSKPEKEVLLTNLVRGTGNILVENFPDEEDLTQVMQGGQNVLKFKDKIFNPEKCSGMGKVFLRKNLVKNTHDCGKPMNILTLEMFEDEHGLPLVNTVFIIQYDYDLDKGFITIPENSILVFAGGSISNGTVILRNTLILPAALDIEHFMSVNIRGSYREGSLVYLRKHLRLFDGQNWINIGGPSDLGPKDKFEIIEFLKAYVNKCLDIVAPFKIELIPEKNYVEKGVHDIKVSWNYNRLINNQDIRLESGSKYRIYQELDKRVREYTFENIDAEDPVTIVIATTYKGETVSEAVTLTFDQNPGLVIDDELNEESTNPVTNRAITAAIRAIEATLATLATKEELGEYLKKSEAADTYQPKGNYITEHQDLSEYAKSADVAANYQPKGDYQPRGNYLTEDSLNGYAKTSDLDNYALRNHTHSIDDVNGLRDALNHADVDTKYSLSKDGSRIVLTGTDGSSSSVTDETGGGSDVTVVPVVSPSAANAYEIAKINGTSIYGHDAVGSGEGGDTVQWNQIKQSGERIATITINNGTPINVYAPKGGGDDDDDDDDGQPGTILTFFLQTDSRSIPSTPQDGQISDLNSSSGRWLNYMPNSEEGKYIWMSQIYRTASGGAYGNWGYPILIDSGTGRAGSDTTDREYIYALSNVENFAVSGTCDPSALDAVQSDGFIPCPEQGDWKDNPQGISQQMRFEFISVRTKNENGWSKFSYPVLWSSYGLNGSDGDGVEYIYYAGPVPPTVGSLIYDPSEWYSDEESKAGLSDGDGVKYNSDEYIKRGSGWTDNPQELEAGETQWVSVRKYRSDTDSESSEAEGAYWHAYSTPVVWSYYAKDAIALGALDFDNQTMGIPINDQGGNYAFVETSNAFIYKDTGASITINSLTCEGLWEGDTQIWTASKASSYVTIVGNKVTVLIPENEPTLTDISGKTYSLRFRATASGIEDRTGTIKLIGLNTGTDGRSYSLLVGAAVIRKGVGTQTGQVYPSTISPTMVTVKGAQEPEVSTPTELPTNFSIRYSIDGSSVQTLNSNTINVPNNIQSNITIQLVHSGQVIDQETLLVVNDGTQGISATVYNIVPVSSDVTSNSEGTSGTLKFRAYRKYGSGAIEYLSNGHFGSSTGEYGAVAVKFENEETITTTESDGVFTATISSQNQHTSIQIDLSVGTSMTKMCSIVIPVSPDGSAVQPLMKGILREVYISDYNTPKKFFSSQEDPDNGYYYQDFVKFNMSGAEDLWGTYLCIKDCNIEPIDIPIESQYFVQLDYTFGEVVSYLIADRAFINKLTSKQVVITNNAGTVVAGMTSGNSIPATDSDGYYDPQGTPIQNTNSIRIWAGRTQNNVATAPFRVNESGEMWATNAHITGEVNATSGSFKGSVDATSFKSTSFKVYDTSTASESNLRMEMTTWGTVSGNVDTTKIDSDTLSKLTSTTPVIVVSDGTNQYVLNMLALGSGGGHLPVRKYYNIRRNETTGEVTVNQNFTTLYDSSTNKYYDLNGQYLLNNVSAYDVVTSNDIIMEITSGMYAVPAGTVYKRITFVNGTLTETGERYLIAKRCTPTSDSGYYGVNVTNLTDYVYDKSVTINTAESFNTNAFSITDTVTGLRPGQGDIANSRPVSITQSQQIYLVKPTNVNSGSSTLSQLERSVTSLQEGQYGSTFITIP